MRPSQLATPEGLFSEDAERAAECGMASDNLIELIEHFAQKVPHQRRRESSWKNWIIETVAFERQPANVEWAALASSSQSGDNGFSYFTDLVKRRALNQRRDGWLGARQA